MNACVHASMANATPNNIANAKIYANASTYMHTWMCT